MVHRLKKHEQSDIALCLARCCICCLYVFETCIRYINHNAYTVVAMQGIDFCPAAARVSIAGCPACDKKENYIGILYIYLGKIWNHTGDLSHNQDISGMV